MHQVLIDVVMLLNWVLERLYHVFLCLTNAFISCITIYQRSAQFQLTC